MRSWTDVPCALRCLMHQTIWSRYCLWYLTCTTASVVVSECMRSRRSVPMCTFIPKYH